MDITQLPDNILLNILQLCNIKDLVTLSFTCSRFYHLIKDPYLWRHLCFRDFNVIHESGSISSYEKIYKNLLHKYGYMLGLYQSQIEPYGGLFEIRFQSGFIKGIEWEPTSDVMDPLKESVIFSVDGSEARDKCLCLPDRYPHHCSLHMNKRKGMVTQYCSDNQGHIKALCDKNEHASSHFLDYADMKILYLNEVITKGLIYKRLILPKPDDVPNALRRRDGSLPKQIITPGLFKGTFATHGIEVLLFKYKDEHEICGYKITGDPNVYASKISVKINLKYPVDTVTKDNNSIKIMSAVEPRSTDKPVDQIPEQPFSVPHECYIDFDFTYIPSRCIARYHGFGQVAYQGFQKPTFIPIQVVIFNNDLIGVIWIKLECFSLFSRVKETFTTNICETGEAAYDLK